jgi:hypothetical protein
LGRQQFIPQKTFSEISWIPKIIRSPHQKAFVLQGGFTKKAMKRPQTNGADQHPPKNQSGYLAFYEPTQRGQGPGRFIALYQLTQPEKQPGQDPAPNQGHDQAKPPSAFQAMMIKPV